jgi:hypothetical protein
MLLNLYDSFDGGSQGNGCRRNQKDCISQPYWPYQPKSFMTASAITQSKHKNSSAENAFGPNARKDPNLGCAERIVNSRIKKVWIGIEDPDPSVDRKGIKYFR